MASAAELAKGAQGKVVAMKVLEDSTRKRLPPIVRAHDIFNLVALALLNILNTAYLIGALEGAVLLYSSLAYFLVDMVYVGLFPRCVKSPMVIIGHHIASLALILIPLSHPKYTWCLAYCMLVEVNTWLLIAKRTFPGGGGPAMEALFYASWVLLRCVWYPWLVVVFYREWQVESAALGTPWNPVAITPVFQSVLTALNVHWSIALFSKPSKSKQL